MLEEFKGSRINTKSIWSRLRNITNHSLPPNYHIPDTNPLVILQINPTRHFPLDYNKLTYMIVHGLDSFVQDAVQFRGDSPIPQDGLVLRSENAAILARSHLPGTQDLTYGIMARVLRGIWEISALFGPCELDMEVYVGGQDVTQHRGHLALFLIAASRETA